MSRNFKQSERKGKWNTCLACKQLRYIASRGLCMKCWKVPEIRERFKDRRLVPRNPINVEHHLILSNEELTEPRKLFFLAHRTVARYGERVSRDDLIQIGLLVMIKGVKDYDPNWQTTLFRFCKRGIASEMNRYAVNELRSSTMGVTHNDFVEFIYNDAIRGGTLRYNVGESFNVTDHALQRYRERIKENGTRKELKRLVEHSTRLPVEREEIWLLSTQYDSSRKEVREYKNIIFIMGPSLHLWSHQQQLITVLDKHTSIAGLKGII